MNTQAVLDARQVSKHYGRFLAVDNVNLRVMPHTIHAVIGPNGAGKTTLFHSLTGTVPITQGSIVVNGRDVSRLPAHKRVQHGIARSFQVTSLFPELSVRENLRIAAQGTVPRQALRFWTLPTGPLSHAERIDDVLERMGLTATQHMTAGTLAHGQQRRLEIAMALIAQPQIVFLDEPTSGMGVDDIDAMKQLIHGLKSLCTVVLIEHNMGIVMDISDTITVMQQGRVLVEGPPDAIRNNDRVRQAYLGNMITGGQA